MSSITCGSCLLSVSESKMGLNRSQMPLKIVKLFPLEFSPALLFFTKALKKRICNDTEYTAIKTAECHIACQLSMVFDIIIFHVVAIRPVCTWGTGFFQIFRTYQQQF